MKRLAIIVPYDEQHIDNFTNHFKSVISEEDFYYKLCFIKQKSNRPLNKGKLFNIGFSLMKNQFDYFCFHDIDMIPVTTECDYTYSDKPISLIEGVKPLEFGEHEKIKDYDDFSLPNEDYFGGALIFSKVDYEKINGYSNEYWGLGYSGLDLMSRLAISKLPLRTVIEKPMSKTYGEFNGLTSSITIPAQNNRLRKTTDKNFSISLWFNISDLPPYGADVDNNRCEYFLFGRPGFHTGISITHEGHLKAIVWNKDKQPTELYYKNLGLNKWYSVCLVVEDEVMKFYVNGVNTGKAVYGRDGALYKYKSEPYHIGVGNPLSSFWKSFFKGFIGEVGLWDCPLNSTEVNSIFENGITDKKGMYSTSNVPVGFWDFNSGYDNLVFDMTGNGNHGVIRDVSLAKKTIKSTQERYLPYRRKGYYAYIGEYEKFKHNKNQSKSFDPEVKTNRNLFIKKLPNFEDEIKMDGLSSTRFRIVNRKNYQEKHEVIEVVI